MVKGQKSNPNQQKAQKVHKTLREKLRKKRQQQKKHKKQKSLQKKMYNPEEEKLRFFQKAEQANDNDGEVRLKKIKKYIEKFINIYEDDLDDFYDMFKTLDEGGFIDISSLENKALYKCLKKLFKYLPLAKDKGEYRKIQSSKMSLHVFIKNKVSQSIEDYLENGSKKSQSNDESSEERQDKATKKQRRKKHAKIQDQQQPQQLRLYKQTATDNSNAMGPYIPPEVRQQMAKMFEEQLAKRQQEKEQLELQEENEFDKIFGASRTKKQIKQGKIVEQPQTVPQHLMAKGSAVLGQKVAIDDNEIEEYNKVHRPKKLIDLHKQLKQGYSAQDPNKRKPFNRERDVLGSGKMSLMSNSTFFDFKNRMTKPKTTNQFL